MKRKLKIFTIFLLVLKIKVSFQLECNSIPLNFIDRNNLDLANTKSKNDFDIESSFIPPRRKNNFEDFSKYPLKKRNLNDQLEVKQSWELSKKIDYQSTSKSSIDLNGPCPYCTLASLDQQTMTKFAKNALIWGNEGLSNSIVSSKFKTSFKKFTFGDFDDFVKDFPKGTGKVYTLTYQKPNGEGSMVPLKVWKNYNGDVFYRTIDFSKSPQNRHLYSDLIPKNQDFGLIEFKDKSRFGNLDDLGFGKNKVANIPEISNEIMPNKLWLGEVNGLPMIGHSKASLDLTTALYNKDLDGIKKVFKDLDLEFAENYLNLSPKLIDDMIIKYGKNTEGGGDAVNKFVQEISRKSTGGESSDLIKKKADEMRDIVKDELAGKLKVDKSRTELHGRDEHVITANVLRVYQDIITEFVQKKLKYLSVNQMMENLSKNQLRKFKNSQFYKDATDLTSFFTEKLSNNIQKDMVGKFQDGDNYIDPNSNTYGLMIKVLKSSAANQLELKRTELRNNYDYNTRLADDKKFIAEIDAVVEVMKTHKFYLDEQAKYKWQGINPKAKAKSKDKKQANKQKQKGKIEQKTDEQKMYKEAKQEVWSMFDGIKNKIDVWIKDLADIGII